MNTRHWNKFGLIAAALMLGTVACAAPEESDDDSEEQNVTEKKPSETSSSDGSGGSGSSTSSGDGGSASGSGGSTPSQTVDLYVGQMGYRPGVYWFDYCNRGLQGTDLIIVRVTDLDAGYYAEYELLPLYADSCGYAEIACTDVNPYCDSVSHNIEVYLDPYNALSEDSETNNTAVAFM